MKTHDFDFALPDHLIAQHPLAQRTASRLLVHERSSRKTIHSQFKSLSDFLKPGDLLVLNNSKVIPARLFGHKKTGGKVEFLVERLVGADHFWAHGRASKSLKLPTAIILENGMALEVLDRKNELFYCFLPNAEAVLQAVGHMPLPPYIHRSDEISDRARYQTVYAHHAGSVAAPTAGLHFDTSLLATLQSKGIQIATLTLHVGAGTFQPVRSEDIRDHRMHKENIHVSEEICQQVNATRAAGHRVIAVGTTALRSLESATIEGKLCPFQGETDIFIYPGYQFKMCDGLITNFHVPQSTLLMLVAAFIGHADVMALYREAIKEQYRFFSYGDACLFL